MRHQRSKPGVPPQDPVLRVRATTGTPRCRPDGPGRSSATVPPRARPVPPSPEWRWRSNEPEWRLDSDISHESALLVEPEENAVVSAAICQRPDVAGSDRDDGSYAPDRPTRTQSIGDVPPNQSADTRSNSRGTQSRPAFSSSVPSHLIAGQTTWCARCRCHDGCSPDRRVK